MARRPQLPSGDTFETVIFARRGPDGFFYVGELVNDNTSYPFSGQPGDGWPALRRVVASLEATGWRVTQQIENGSNDLYVTMQKSQEG